MIRVLSHPDSRMYEKCEVTEILRIGGASEPERLAKRIKAALQEGLEGLVRVLPDRITEAQLAVRAVLDKYIGGIRSELASCSLSASDLQVLRRKNFVLSASEICNERIRVTDGYFPIERAGRGPLKIPKLRA